MDWRTRAPAGYGVRESAGIVGTRTRMKEPLRSGKVMTGSSGIASMIGSGPMADGNEGGGSWGGRTSTTGGGNGTGSGTGTTTGGNSWIGGSWTGGVVEAGGSGC